MSGQGSDRALLNAGPPQPSAPSLLGRHSSAPAAGLHSSVAKRRPWLYKAAVVACMTLAVGAVVGIAVGVTMGNRLSAGAKSATAYTPGQAGIAGLAAGYNAQAAPRSAVLAAGGPASLRTGTSSISARVMTFNVRYKNAGDKGWHSWAARAQAVSALIADVSPDLFGLQEVKPDQHADLQASLGDSYDSVYVPRAGGDEGTPVFWRKGTYRLLTTTTKWLSETPDVPGSISWGAGSRRVVTAAWLKHLPSGRTLAYFNTHLDNVSGLARARGAAMVAGMAGDAVRGRWAAPVPVLITGDFNSYTGWWDSSVRAVMDGVPGVVELLREADPRASSLPTFNGFASRPGGDRIDWIFAARPPNGSSDPPQAVRAWVHARRYLGVIPSDHFPVVADVVM